MKKTLILLAITLSVTNLWAQSEDASKDATFKVLKVEKLDKKESLEGVERNRWSKLSKEHWASLPNLIEVTIEFHPFRGNMDDPEGTFLLTPSMMALKINDHAYHSIGVYSFKKLSQRYSSNTGPVKSNGKLSYGIQDIKMRFLIPEDTREFTLVYKDYEVAEGSVK